MIITGYTNEYGTVIPMEDADDYIKNRIKGNQEDREWFIDYAWDVLMGNTDENVKLKEEYLMMYAVLKNVTNKETTLTALKNMSRNRR